MVEEFLNKYASYIIELNNYIKTTKKVKKH